VAEAERAPGGPTRDGGESHLREVLAAAGAGVWTWNARGDVVTSDERVRALYGFDEHDAPRDIRSWLERIHPDDRERLRRLMALPGDEPITIEFRAVLPGGRVVWRQRIRRVERDAAGGATRITGIDFDITERKETQLDLQAARDALRRRDRGHAHAGRRAASRGAVRARPARRPAVAGALDARHARADGGAGRRAKLRDRARGRARARLPVDPRGTVQRRQARGGAARRRRRLDFSAARSSWTARPAKARG
jgi:PAS domain S-box-containing protein